MTSPSSLPNEEFNEELYRLQRELLVTPPLPFDPQLELPKNFIKQVPESVRQKGLKAIYEGKVATLVSAGGQGTRLGIPGPKGTAEVLGEKTLFELLCEGVLAAQTGAQLQVAIMTSLQNDEQTRDFFHEHNYFGLDPNQIHFFIQNELPLMNEAGSWFADAEGKTVTAPNGNGEAFQLLYKKGIWEQWGAQGIQYVNTIPIDNALAQPFDPEIVGLQIEKNADLSVKAIMKRDKHEHLGLLVEKRGKLSVLEYSEQAHDSWMMGSVGLFSYTMEFIEKIHTTQLPLHLAKKKIEGHLVYKFEKFNFDLFPYAKSYIGVIADRKTCFSPLKNATGQDSFITVKEDLLGS